MLITWHTYLIEIDYKKDLALTKEGLMAMVNIDKFSTINDLFGEINGG